MKTIPWRHDRPGMALVTVLLILLVVGAISTAAALITSNAWIIEHHDARQSILETVAESGLEEARALINGDSQVADSVFKPLEDRLVAYTILENGVTVTDASGNTINGVRRFTYAGPIGATTGQYGIFGSVVTIVVDRNGDRLIRRRDIVQKSFAQFAYFTDVEGEIVFAGGDKIEGPVHSNDILKIQKATPGPVFAGPVSTARTIRDRSYGTYEAGFTENAPRIPMPTTTDLQKLREYATESHMVFTAPSGGGAGEAMLRIEFDTAGDIGFFRVYQAAHDSMAYWVNGGRPRNYSSRGLEHSPNCGDFHNINGITRFVSALDHRVPLVNQNWNHFYNAGKNNGGICLLGGDNTFNQGEFKVADSVRIGTQNFERGRWRAWPDTIHPAIRATGRPDSAYIYPMDRLINTNFKGVIYVQGKVAVSGVVRGHLTLAATDDIIIVDNLEYATIPGSANRLCTIDDNAEFDILGLFSGGRVLVADNTLNSPTNPKPPGNNYLSFRSPQDLNIHATVLALDQFTVMNYDSGNTGVRGPCNNNPSTFAFGRGCLRLIGGIIQRSRGPVGTSAGYGFLKNYSYDDCVMVNPPPYFPTTGHSVRGRYYDVDPVGFDVDTYFAALASKS
jgi:hypothetical protein